MIKGGSIEDASQYYCDKVRGVQALPHLPGWLGDPLCLVGRQMSGSDHQKISCHQLLQRDVNDTLECLLE